MNEQAILDSNAGPDIAKFLDLSKQGKWNEFDHLVLENSENIAYLEWTIEGIADQNVDVRDLAISLLEQTTSPLFEKRVELLNTIRDSDSNVHLRRKAAIALFKHGERNQETILLLHDAYTNDSELKDQVAGLLGFK
jgi:hypothetical protein